MRCSHAIAAAAVLQLILSSPLSQAQAQTDAVQPAKSSPDTAALPLPELASEEEQQGSDNDAADQRLISGYVDVTATYPLRHHDVDTSIETGNSSSIASELVRQSVVTTLDIEARLSSHWKAVIRPAFYYNYLLDPLVGADYQRSLGKFEIDALQAVALPLSTLSRETERLATYQESVRVAYHIGKQSPYMQVGGTYSWFAHHVLSDQAAAQAEGEAYALAVDHDTLNIGLGDDLYLWHDQIMLAAGFDFAHIAFRNAGTDASLWATNITLLSVTYTPGYVYLSAAFSLAKDDNLISWPDIPQISFSIGAFF